MKHKLLKLQGTNKGEFTRGVPVEMSLKEIGELPFIITGDKFVNSGFVFGEVENNYRNDKNIINRTLFPIDIDSVPNDIFDELIEGLKSQGINAVVHTSHNHKLKGNRYRVIAETSRTMTPDEFPNAVPNFIEDIPVLRKYTKYIDLCIKTKSQFFLAPSHPPETEAFARKEYVNNGAPYIPDTQKRTTTNGDSRKAEHLLISPTPQTARTVCQVEYALSQIPADCSYITWRNVIWGLLSTSWSCSVELAMTWSKTAPELFNEVIFNNVINGYDPTRKDSPTLGTIYYLAKKGGQV